MNTRGVISDKIYAKLIALSMVYEKEESQRQVFLEKISYTRGEIEAVMEEVAGDFEFRNWIHAAIPVMQCKGRI